jgi:hypothetical protein
MQTGEAQVVAGRLVTGPQRTLGRTLTWAGGWGIGRVSPLPDALPSAEGIEEEEEEIAVTLVDAPTARPLWQRAVAATVGVAVVALLFGVLAVRRHRSAVVVAPRSAPALPAVVPAPSPASPAAPAAPAAPDAPAVRLPAPLPAAPKAAALPAATRVKAAARLRPPAARPRSTQPPAAAASEWVDPFGDGSWVDMPAGKR